MGKISRKNKKIIKSKNFLTKSTTKERFITCSKHTQTMEKTITFKIETPRFWKNYKARRSAKKQIAKMQFEEIAKIFSGKKVESDKVPDSTQTITQKVESEKVTNSTTEKLEKKLEDGTYFVSPADVIKARTVLKQNSIKARVVKSNGKDYFVEPKEEQNTDEFNKFMKSDEDIKSVYHWSPYTRMVKA